MERRTYRMAKLSECKSARVKFACLDWSINHQFVLTTRPAFKLGQPFDINEEFEFLKLWIGDRDQYCAAGKHPNAFPDGPDKVTYLERLTDQERMPLCIAFNDQSLKDYIPSYNIDGHDRKILVIRQFYTADCPKYIFRGVEQPLNAIVVGVLNGASG
jgi:hypothetical protein